MTRLLHATLNHASINPGIPRESHQWPVGINLYWCTYPSLKGGERSLVYFNEIAKLKEDTYIDNYLVVSEDVLARDFAAQVWRNSQIVAEKYRYLKNATQAVMLGVIPWALLLAATALDDGRIAMR